MTLGDLAQVFRGSAKHKPLFMQEFIYFRGGGGKGPKADRWLSRLQSCSWLTLEKGTRTLSPLPVCERGLEFPGESSRPPLPLHWALCVRVRVSAAGGPSSGGRDQTSCLSPVTAAV